MIAFSCPGCMATFNLPDETAGKSARCSKCNHRFTVPAGKGKPAAAAAVKSAPTPVAAGARKVALNPMPEVLEAEVVEVVEEPRAPRRAPKPLDDVEVVEAVDRVEVVDDGAIAERKPPVRISRDDDDDDDAPRRGKRRRRKSGSSTGLIVGLIVGGVAMVAGVVVVIVLLVNRSNRPAANAGLPPDVRFDAPANQGNPGQGNPAAANGGVILDKQDQLTRTDPMVFVTGNSYSKRYTVQLDSSKTYKIDMTATHRFGVNRFDPFLRIERNGAMIAEHDDIDEDNNLDASIVFRPPQTGAYVIVATSFVPLQTGSYRISVRTMP